MKRCHLFVCNTYMQLIIAIQIRLMLFADDDADLVLSDHSVNAGTIVENLKKTGIFRRVGYARSKSYMKRPSTRKRIEDTYLRLFGCRKRMLDGLWNDGVYDSIFRYNSGDLIVFLYYDQSVRGGMIPQMNRFEESVFSYELMTRHGMGKRYRLIRGIRGLLGKKDPFTAAEDYYCHYPELFSKNVGKCYGIPHFDRKNKVFLDHINTVFGYDPASDIYQQKYIYFASSADVDGKNIGETELVLKIADIVGRENLLVKMHPRDGRHVYEEYGIAVSKNSTIPWEVIQMNHDFSSHIFLSVSSSSVLNATAMLGDHILTYYFFPLIRGADPVFDSFCENVIVQAVAALKKLGALQEMHIADSLEVLNE